MLEWFKNMMGIIPKREQALRLEDEVTTVTKADLQKMTKAELEGYGRTLGIELDKRKKKADLIAEVEKAQ
tara:strand:+ start:1392 stop:1601 length:210 start_codon:yes stop_codon:yes gene_type:complete